MQYQRQDFPEDDPLSPMGPYLQGPSSTLLGSGTFLSRSVNGEQISAS